MAANLIVMSDDDEIEDDLWEIAANYVNNFVPRRRRVSRSWEPADRA